MDFDLTAEQQAVADVVTSVLERDFVGRRWLTGA